MIAAIREAIIIFCEATTAALLVFFVLVICVLINGHLP